MSNPSYYDTVERFINHLESSGLRKRLELNDQDIADTLWLALQMGVEPTQSQEKPPEPQKETISEDTNIQSSEAVEPPINIYTPPSNLLPEKSEKAEKKEGLPFQAPAAPALPNKLQIGRALRPLMRKVPSHCRRILDIEATVNRIVDALIVEQDIWLPITKPQPERWLNLELVVEENRTSFIWQETINELNQILETNGIFRTVRSWNLLSNEQGTLQLVSRKKGKQKNQCHYNYRELYHSNGRGLILLISDCVSTIWQQGIIYQWLQKWSNQSPTVIMQLLPERLWLSSELGLGYKVKLSAFSPGVPNSKLIFGEDLDIEQALNLPIITLESESLKEWAKVVAGYGKSKTPAIILDIEFIKNQLRETAISPSSEISPEAIVDRFLSTASPTAQILAGLMAAVPVSLPVVHLIQKTMLPKSTPVNVAEVFLSGMIEKNTNNREVDEYDFVEGVRKLLNQAMRLEETENVLDVVSAYIAEKMGLSIKSFTALLLNLSDLSQEQQGNVLPFAQIAIGVLHNLGGKYADFADNVQKTLDNQISITPQFQEFTFKVATISIEEDFMQQEIYIQDDPLPPTLETFDFEVATIELETGFLGLEKKEIKVNFSRRQAQYFIEDLGNEIKLEMVSIPKGTFIMGSPEEEKGSSDDERPQHQVTIKPFFFGKYPITQKQWQVVAALPQINQELNLNPSRFEGENRPVENVSWDDAIEFCLRLSNYTQRPYRLPSEAEWEYACRAGTTTPFNFGETISTYLANYNGNFTYGVGEKGIYREETTEVGSFELANNFGLYDMHGNVWEWCQDHQRNNYNGAPIDGSAWQDISRDNNRRMLRGGSYILNAEGCRSAYRLNNIATAARNGYGFRVVCAAVIQSRFLKRVRSVNKAPFYSSFSSPAISNR